MRCVEYLGVYGVHVFLHRTRNIMFKCSSVKHQYRVTLMTCLVDSERMHYVIKLYRHDEIFRSN